MTTDPPPPGSPWAAHCPDAFPADWFDALNLSAMPPGFTRFATAEELAVIAGVAPEKPKRTPRLHHTALSSGRKKASGRFEVLNAFVDVTMRTLSRAEIAVWNCLYRDTKPDGTARTAQTDLARRAGCDERTARRAVSALEKRGLLTVVRKGRLGCGPTTYVVKAVTTPTA